MFIANFSLKTRVQKLLVALQDFLDFPKLHPAREMKRIALEESVQYAREQMRTAIGVESAREVLASALREVAIQGRYLEFGVFKGGTITYIAKQLPPSTIVHGFDSFAGLSESWSGDTSRFDAGGRLPRVPGNVVLHQGYFSDTLPLWIADHPGPVAFLHIDCDLYSSTRCIFQNLQDRIEPGTVIVFDEYFNYPNWQDHEFRAFQEFVASHEVRYQYLAYARFQVAVKILGIAKRDPQLSALQSNLSAETQEVCL
jgi:predicted O-methyltransferase YrrM